MNQIVTYVGIIESKINSSRAIAKYDAINVAKIVWASWVLIDYVILDDDVIKDIPYCRLAAISRSKTDCASMIATNIFSIDNMIAQNSKSFHRRITATGGI